MAITKLALRKGKNLAFTQPQKHAMAYHSKDNVCYIKCHNIYFDMLCRYKIDFLKLTQRIRRLRVHCVCVPLQKFLLSNIQGIRNVKKLCRLCQHSLAFYQLLMNMERIYTTRLGNETDGIDKEIRSGSLRRLQWVFWTSC